MPRIYSLEHPITHDIVYIGKTINPLFTRLRSHIGSKCDNPIKRWIDALWSENLIPRISAIEDVDTLDANITEQYWISQFRAWGFSLLNINCNKSALRKNPKKTKIKKPKKYVIYNGAKKHENIFSLNGVFSGHVNSKTSDRVYNIKLCSICNIEFICLPNKNNKYCSRKCAGKNRAGNVEYIESIRASSRNRMKKIVAIEIKTNQEMFFDSINHAALYLKCNNSTISNVINGRGNSAKGYSFKFAKEILPT